MKRGTSGIKGIEGASEVAVNWLKEDGTRKERTNGM